MPTPTEPGHYWARLPDEGLVVRRVIRACSGTLCVVSYRGHIWPSATHVPLEYDESCEWGARIPSADELRQMAQAATNTRWLIAVIDEIHAALCPDETGTWQERARQAIDAAKKLAQGPSGPTPAAKGGEYQAND